MKKLLFLTIPFILFGCGDESSSDNTTLPALTPATVITASPASYDFGDVNAGETKTAVFNINTDGFISSRYSVSSSLGVDITDAEKALSTMFQKQATSASFSIAFTPICKGKLENTLYITTDIVGGAYVSIPLTANIIDNTNTLPYCSNDNPTITVTSTPENVIQTGEVQNLGTQKYVDFDTITDGTKTITIKAVSDTILSSSITGTTSGTFASTTTGWELNNNEVSAKTTVTFNPDTCTGPASDRIRVNGLNGTPNDQTLYLYGTGTATNGRACSNKYPLQTN